MNVKPIRNHKEYREAMDRLNALFQCKKGTIEGDEFEILSIIMDKFENENFPMEFPDPIEAIKFRMDQLGYNQSDLAKIVGLKSRASEIINKKRKLTLEMIRQLHLELNIPAEVLIRAYE